MKAQLLGIQRLTGKSSKTGNDYDFIQLHMAYPSKGIDGLAVKTFSVSPDDFAFSDLTRNISSFYSVDFDDRGRIVDLELINDSSGSSMQVKGLK